MWQIGFNHRGVGGVGGGCLGCRAAGFLSRLMLTPWAALRLKPLIVKGHQRQAQFARTTITPLCAWGNTAAALHTKEPHYHFATKQTLQRCQLGSPWLAEKPHPLPGCRMCEYVSGYISPHTLERFTRIAGKKWLSHSTSSEQATCPWLPSEVASRGLSSWCQK